MKANFSSYLALEINRFENVRVLDMNCTIYDLKSEACFKWTNINVENKLVSQMRGLFANVCELYMRFYSGSLKQLAKSLVHMAHLKVFELDQPNVIDENLDGFKRVNGKPSALQLNTLLLHSVSAEIVAFLLSYLSANLQFLQSLSVFQANKYLYSRYEDLNALESAFLEVGSLGRLSHLYTNMFQMFGIQNLEPSPRLAHVDVLCVTPAPSWKYTHRKNTPVDLKSIDGLVKYSNWRHMDIETGLRAVYLAEKVNTVTIDIFCKKYSVGLSERMKKVLKELKCQEDHYELVTLNLYFFALDETKRQQATLDLVRENGKIRVNLNEMLL